MKTFGQNASLTNTLAFAADSPAKMAPGMKAKVSNPIITDYHNQEAWCSVSVQATHNSKLASKTVKTQAVQKFIDLARKECLQLKKSDWWFLKGNWYELVHDKRYGVSQHLKCHDASSCSLTSIRPHFPKRKMICIGDNESMNPCLRYTFHMPEKPQEWHQDVTSYDVKHSKNFWVFPTSSALSRSNSPRVDPPYPAHKRSSISMTTPPTKEKQIHSSSI